MPLVLYARSLVLNKIWEMIRNVELEVVCSNNTVNIFSAGKIVNMI